VSAELLPVVHTLQRLIRQPSPSGSESALALLTLEEFRSAGCDHAELDAAGNALGLWRGREPGPGWLLITHLDHVHEGDLALWAHPPYAGELEGGRVHGRGAVDIKGPLAAHIHALAAGRPRRDVLIASLVEEELGGRGAAALIADLPRWAASGYQPGACIVAEPSSNRLMLGHRGVSRLRLRFTGRAHHASFALHDQNPLFALATLLQRISSFQFPVHPVLGVSTLTPTQVWTDSGSENLTPNWVELVLDWRSSEPDEERRRALEELCRGLAVQYSWPPLWSTSSTPGFYLPPDHPLVALLRSYVPGEPQVWRFATDGRYTAAAGIPTIGFGCGDPELAHTTDESIAVEELTAHVATLSRLLQAEAPA
jgi:acetylornithine deacetylase/succinyl-diaminopimelate desuccinylase-like protein